MFYLNFINLKNLNQTYKNSLLTKAVPQNLIVENKNDGITSIYD
jgi:hypothetical protein